MSSPVGDSAEASPTHTLFLATHVAKFERVFRELGDWASTVGPMSAAPTGAGHDAAGRRDAAADGDAVIAAAAVAAADHVGRNGAARDAQEVANVCGEAAVHAAADGAGDASAVGLSAGRVGGDDKGKGMSKADAGLCVSRGPACVAANTLSDFEGPAFSIPDVPVEAASNMADHGGKRKAVDGPLACEKVGGKKVQVADDAAWNEASKDTGTCVTQGSMAEHQPARPDELEAAAMAVEDIGTSAAAFEAQMNIPRALSAPDYTIMRLLANKTAAVDKHLASAGKTYRTAVRWAAACHKAMSTLHKEYQGTLDRAATAMLPSKADTAANDVA